MFPLLKLTGEQYDLVWITNHAALVDISLNFPRMQLQWTRSGKRVVNEHGLAKTYRRLDLGIARVSQLLSSMGRVATVCGLI